MYPTPSRSSTQSPPSLVDLTLFVGRVGEMVLVDAGAYRDGYNGDITRTWPIDGRFTEPQLELYSAVLRVQLALIEVFLMAN